MSVDPNFNHKRSRFDLQTCFRAPGILSIIDDTSSNIFSDCLRDGEKMHTSESGMAQT
jgi:hypothetical protein